MKSINDKRVIKNYNVGASCKRSKKDEALSIPAWSWSRGAVSLRLCDGVVEIVRTDIDGRELDEPISKIIKSVINPN